MKTIGKTKSLSFLLAAAFLLILFFLCNQIYLHMQVQFKPEIPADTEILILGDSHAFYALDPDIIGKAFNFSSKGESYIQNYYKLKYALKQNHSLRAVILPIGLHSFSDFRKDQIIFNPQWLQFINFIELGWIKNKFRPYLIKYVNLRLFEFRGKYSNLFTFYLKGQKQTKTKQPNVFRQYPKKSFHFFKRQQKVQLAKKRAERHLKGSDGFSKEMVIFFKMILNECAKNKIHIILLKLPITEEYYTAASQLSDINHLYARVSHIARQYKNIHYLDYQKLFFRNGADFFFDPDHLNKIGAKNISRLVSKNLICLGNR